MKQLRRVRTGLNRFLSGVCIFLFSVMILVGSYQIITRYFFHRPSTVSEELLTFSFTWLSLLAAAYIFGKRDHMRMRFLVEKMPPRWRRSMEFLTEILVLLFAGTVEIYGGISIVRLTMSQVTASLGIPMGLVYCIIPVSGMITAFYALSHLWEMLYHPAEEVE